MAERIDYWRDCKKKQVVRRAWLEASRARKAQIPAMRGKPKRPVRYLTFCGEDALDIFYLELNNIIDVRDGKLGPFYGVTYFDSEDDVVMALGDRLPGAVGFPYKFEDLILFPSPPDAEALLAEPDPLLSPGNDPNLPTTHDYQKKASSKINLIKQFPFDIINLDLCGYLFKGEDALPGPILRSIRKVCEHQRLNIRHEGKDLGPVLGFTLMFTTELGPQNMSADVLNTLEECLQQNLSDHQRLFTELVNRNETHRYINLHRC